MIDLTSLELTVNFHVKIQKHSKVIPFLSLQHKSAALFRGLTLEPISAPNYASDLFPNKFTLHENQYLGHCWLLFAVCFAPESAILQQSTVQAQQVSQCHPSSFCYSASVSWSNQVLN